MENKRELKRKYKQTLPPMGVYMVKNLLNQKILLDSSKNLPGKINRCMFQLRQGTHMNRALQRDFIESGDKNFVFSVVDCLDPKETMDYDYTDDLALLEEMWLERLQPYGEKGYNRIPDKKEA